MRLEIKAEIFSVLLVRHTTPSHRSLSRCIPPQPALGSSNVTTRKMDALELYLRFIREWLDTPTSATRSVFTSAMFNLEPISKLAWKDEGCIACTNERENRLSSSSTWCQNSSPVIYRSYLRWPSRKNKLCSHTAVLQHFPMSVPKFESKIRVLCVVYIHHAYNLKAKSTRTFTTVSTAYPRQLAKFIVDRKRVKIWDCQNQTVDVHA